MGDLSDNFSRYEFECHCGCEFNAADIELIKVLEDVRIHFKNRIIGIHSGCRCPYWNGHEKGTKDSQHQNGIAADFEVIGVTTRKVYDYLDKTYPDKYGIGYYSSWIHLDIRKEKGRW